MRGIFAGGNFSIMTAGAGLCDTVVLENGIFPAGRAVTVTAGIVTRHVVGRFPDSCMAIMTAATGSDDRHVINFSHLPPGGSRVAILAGSGRGDMVKIHGLSGRETRTAMTAYASLGSALELS